MNIFKLLFGYVRGLLALGQRVEQHSADIHKLRAEVSELTQEVRALGEDLRSLRIEVLHNQERLVLKLENELLRFERRFPAQHRRKKLED